MKNRFEDKVVLVTGGSSGIGFATASRLVQEGADVVLTGRSQKGLDDAVERLGRKATGVVADVTDLKALDQLYATVRTRHGRLDGLFANAGIATFEPLEQVSEQSYDELMDANVKGVFFTVQKAVPLLARGAAVVVNSSVAGSTGNPMSSVYSATKAAVRSMARTMSAGLIERGVRVNAVSPGPIETPIWQHIGGVPKDRTPAVREQIKQENPLKRFGTPEEVAAAVAFLLSSESSYVVGAELFVDGGVTQL